jgi:hypothetical protein
VIRLLSWRRTRSRFVGGGQQRQYGLLSTPHKYPFKFGPSAGFNGIFQEALTPYVRYQALHDCEWFPSPDTFVLKNHLPRPWYPPTLTYHPHFLSASLRLLTPRRRRAPARDMAQLKAKSLGGDVGGRNKSNYLLLVILILATNTCVVYPTCYSISS